MPFVTTQPEMSAWATKNLQGIGWRALRKRNPFGMRDGG